jgi:peptide/nickel transport system substrate-binding protein
MRRRDLLRSSLGAGLGATIGSLLGLPRIARAQGTRTLRFVRQADAAILDPMITTSLVAIPHAFPAAASAHFRGSLAEWQRGLQA